MACKTLGVGVQGVLTDPKLAGSLLDYKDGKVNGIPVWVWIVVPLLAVLLLLIVTGAHAPLPLLCNLSLYNAGGCFVPLSLCACMQAGRQTFGEVLVANPWPHCVTQATLCSGGGGSTRLTRSRRSTSQRCEHCHLAC